MRLFLVTCVFAVGCGNDVLDNTAYRRLVDAYDTNDQCLAEGNFARCYQLMTFCADGKMSAVFDTREEGKYSLDGSDVIGQLPTVTVVFDLNKESSVQLPGRHPWELVKPLIYDCP
jgi:hypothetical protein